MRRLLALLFVSMVAFTGDAAVKVLAIKHTATDSTAPEAISDLATSSPTASQCTLSWSAPHEDGASGGAVASYDCRRRAGSTFVEGDYAAATTLTGEPSPAAPTTGESFAATGLSASTQYAFACKSQDEIPNVSAISNAATCTTSAPPGFCAGGTFGFCDEFSSASDPPTNWTEANATTWINTGTVLTSPTSGTPSVLYRTTDMGSSTQYAIVKFVNNGIGDMGLVLNYSTTNDTYTDIVYYSGGKIWWGLIHLTGTTPAFTTDVADCTYTMLANDYLTAKVTGTGTTRVMQVWVSTTAPTGAPTGTATCTFTAGTGSSHTSPATADACDLTLCVPSHDTSGLKAGVYILGIDSGKQFDNFAAGP